MDPLLSKIEALIEPGCYSLTFALPTGEDRAVVVRVRDGSEVLPPANAFTGWPSGSASFVAAMAVVRLLDEARRLAGPVRQRMVDIEGGWDVGLGNVVLSDAGPACVAHGAMEQTEPGIYRCPGCGAAAGFES